MVLILVPPVPGGTLGSSLTPERTIQRSVFSLFPCDIGSRQVFLVYSVPCLLWTSSSSPAIVWSPRHCNLRRWPGGRSMWPAMHLRSATVSANFLEPVLSRTSSFVMWSRCVTCKILRRHRWWRTFNFCAVFVVIFHVSLAYTGWAS